MSEVASEVDPPPLTLVRLRELEFCLFFGRAAF